MKIVVMIKLWKAGMVWFGFKPRTTGVEGWKEGADASTEPWWPPQTELDNFEQFDRRRCRMPNAECRMPTSDDGEIEAHQIWGPILCFGMLASSLGGGDGQSAPVWPEKKHQMSINSCPKMISLEKWLILTYLQKLPKNVGDLDKLIVAKGFKKLPKVK